MHTKWKVGVVIGAMVLATLAIGVVQSRAGKELPNLTGTWTLDAARSDLPSARRGEGRDGGRRWGDGGAGRSGPGAEGRGFRRRGPALPRILRITQGEKGIQFADSAGTLFQEVRFGAGSKAPDGEPRNVEEEVLQLTGRWDDGTLNVERTSPRGGMMVQEYKLADHGRTLEVRMERKRQDEGSRSDGAGTGRSGPRGFKLVYRRAA